MAETCWAMSPRVASDIGGAQRRSHVVKQAQESGNAGGGRGARLDSLVRLHWQQVVQRGGLICDGIVPSLLMSDRENEDVKCMCWQADQCIPQLGPP